jgi:hypothetical protein
MLFKEILSDEGITTASSKTNKGIIKWDMKLADVDAGDICFVFFLSVIVFLHHVFVYNWRKRSILISD